jgi:hypothetical protein
MARDEMKGDLERDAGEPEDDEFPRRRGLHPSQQFSAEHRFSPRLPFA